MADIHFSEAAKEYLADLVKAKLPEAFHVRVFVNDPGTPRAETCIAYCKEGEEKPEDTAIDLGGLKAFIEQRSLDFLEDAEVDYVKDAMGGELTIRAPNARLPKVGPDSSLEDRLNYVLWNDINPSLAMHGGQVHLVDLVEEEQGHVAVLQFGGGCQGCGMVDTTLKGGIEATLREKLPEIAAVRDITDHSQDDHAYYKA